MRYPKICLGVLGIITAIGAGGTAQASAEAYPSRPIRLVVPFVPGGVTDASARLVADKLGQALGQSVIVDNRPGASGNIGAEMVAKASADGYTLLLGFDGALVTGTHITKPRFNVLADFAPITKVGDATLIFVTSPSVPAKNFKELVAYASSRKSTGLSFGSSGTGTTCHLAGELLKEQAGINLQHIPYKGGSQALTDVLGGSLPVLCTAVASVSQYVKSGQVRAIAVTGSQRIASLPEVPTLMESGVRNFSVDSWVGILAPAGTPPAVVTRLQREIRKVLDQPETRARMLDLGITPVGNSPDEFAKQIRSDYARYGEVVKKAGITLN
ncbi:exported protein (plasmid) [Cupriavidus necator N-1]|uniref:Exported protein n=1 Tax=Cupriavidus necator (strain ATCC 43291 / DSM 13513 / CCUG 52238 / LMG 8453 / N-1) TaxID=1042878 RepID=F8GYV2_CUPNN|nr:tripartite tricarboxylate transporter substrate binding protein [Cupriavidus necator]AEI83043.1 exported protein [Cupriavidus necator N-1]MDX6008457.1 tripartite tricarboxylate transporter substrate binding protein [Cupriavidus necator]